MTSKMEACRRCGMPAAVVISSEVQQGLAWFHYCAFCLDVIVREYEAWQEVEAGVCTICETEPCQCPPDHTGDAAVPRRRV